MWTLRLSRLSVKQVFMQVVISLCLSFTAAWHSLSVAMYEVLRQVFRDFQSVML